MKERKRNLVVRLADDELARAHALAEDLDEPIARVVRKLLNAAYAERFLGVETPASKPQKAAR